LRTGQLNTTLTFYPETQAQSASDGFYSNTEGTGVSIRVSIKQLSGYRRMQYTELINAEVFEAVCFSNAVITKNAKVVYGSRTLFIHAIEEIDDKSFTDCKRLILTTKG
jgi:hypothetical protein